WIVPHTGWAIITRKEFPEQPKEYNPKGIHGYDNQHPLMRAIFIARGPAFRRLHGPGKRWIARDENSSAAATGGEVRRGTVKPFRNTEVYNLVCGSLGIPPAEATNGTLTIDSLKLLDAGETKGDAQKEDESSSSEEEGGEGDGDTDDEDEATPPG